MNETWDRIYDAALQSHKYGGSELAHLVISADDEMRALARPEDADALAERDARIRKEAYRDGWVNGANGVAPPDFSDVIYVLNPQENE